MKRILTESVSFMECRVWEGKKALFFLSDKNIESLDTLFEFDVYVYEISELLPEFPKLEFNPILIGTSSGGNFKFPGFSDEKFQIFKQSLKIEDRDLFMIECLRRSAISKEFEMIGSGWNTNLLPLMLIPKNQKIIGDCLTEIKIEYSIFE
jgi:hypothetical protein